MEDSWCILTLGNTVETALINMVADEFECWYSFKEGVTKFEWWADEKCYGMENDIEAWLYSIDDNKTITIDGKEIDITSVESFYEFLVMQYNECHKDLTK